MRKKNKIITFLLLLFVALIGLSSCKKEIKELKLSGSKMSKEEIRNYVYNYEEYNTAIANGEIGKEISSNWYDFSGKYKYNSIEEEREAVSDISVNGEFYDSFSPMDLKIKINIDFETLLTTKEESKTIKHLTKGKYTLILINGIWWIKGKITSDIKNSYHYVSKTYRKISYKRLSFGENGFSEDALYEIFDEVLFFLFEEGSIMEKMGNNFIESLGKYSNEGDNTDKVKNNVYKTKKATMTERIFNNEKESSIEKSIYEFEKNSYIPKKIESYNYYKRTTDSKTSETITSLKIKKKLMGIINAPINKSRYGW